MLRLQTLGAISLEGADQPRLTSRRKELVLLAYLARRGPRPLSRAEAATLFWQDREDQRARQSLRQALLELRGVVGPALGTEADAIVLAASALEVDATCFEADLDRGDLRAAVSRWRGDFLPGAEDIGGEDLRVWLEAEREGLRRRLRSALTRLVDDAERRGAWAEGVADAAHWVEWLPLDEDGHLRLLRLLDRSGRSGEALSRYAALRARLASMEVPPSAALEQLGRTLERSAASAPAPRAGSAALFTPELAGRDAALAELEAAWRAAGDGRSSVILIEGEAGIGKTRLCEAFLRRLERDHRPPPVFRAEAGEQSASIRLGVPSQLAAGMASAPGLGGAPAAALARLSAVAAAVRERFPAIEPVKGDARSLGHALRDALAAVSDEGPVVVLVDDLPRADAASLEAVHALLERLPRGVLLVATGRTGEDEPRLALPAESAIRRLKLQPLSRSEVEAVVGSILELSPEDRAHLAARLHDQGGGNPFYIVELVSALADEGALAPTDRGAWRLTDREGRLPLPPTVREVIARRVARLTPPGRAALEAAAVLALPFDRSLLSEVSGGSPVEIESGLEELILHRLVRDADGPGRYQFAHELVRRHVDGTVPPRRSEELSARAIGALERRVDEDEQVEAALRYHRTRAAAITSASKRRGWRRLALAGGLAGAGALGLWLWSRGGAPPPPSTIAVMPFAVSGSGELAYLRDGMATLLSSELDGAGSLRSADPRAVAGVAAQVGTPSPGVSEGARVAERIGAGTYVIGDIVEGGGRLRIKAAAYRRGQPGMAVTRAEIEGTTGQLFELVDAVAARLLAGLAQGPYEQLTRVAATATGSLPALKDYLDGEQLFRSGAFHQAARAFQRAATEDTTFALAYYWLSVAAWWADDSKAIDTAAARAVRYGARLAERDRRLFHAWSSFLNGDAAAAGREYREIVALEPENVEAWLQLGEVLFHSGPRRGDPVAAARPAFERVLFFEPEHTSALLHLARIAATERRWADLDSLSRRILQLSPTGEWAVEIKALRSSATQDQDGLRQVLGELRTAPEGRVWNTARYVAVAAQSLTGAEAIVSLLTDETRPAEVRAFGHLARAHLELAQGRVRAARAELQQAEALDRIPASGAPCARGAPAVPAGRHRDPPFARRAPQARGATRGPGEPGDQSPGQSARRRPPGAPRLSARRAGPSPRRHGGGGRAARRAAGGSRRPGGGDGRKRRRGQPSSPARSPGRPSRGSREGARGRPPTRGQGRADRWLAVLLAGAGAVHVRRRAGAAGPAARGGALVRLLLEQLDLRPGLPGPGIDRARRHRRAHGTTARSRRALPPGARDLGRARSRAAPAGRLGAAGAPPALGAAVMSRSRKQYLSRGRKQAEMIARQWHGRVRSSDADAYYDYLLDTGLMDYRQTPGNRGVQVLRRRDGDVVHYLLTTLWDSWDSIKAFAGEDVERARYYPEDTRFLLELEPTVSHFEVLGE